MSCQNDKQQLECRNKMIAILFPGTIMKYFLYPVCQILLRCVCDKLEAILNNTIEYSVHAILY